MDRIKGLKILGYNYDVCYSPPRDDGGMESAGRCSTGKQVVLIDPLQCKQAQESTLLHEVIEVLNYHLELGLGHQTIMALEAGLYTVFTDNGINVGVLISEEK